MMLRARFFIALRFLLSVSTVVGGREAHAEDAPATCEHLTAAADEHTCLHGDVGPFASVGSVPHPDGTLTTNVNTTHVLYTVALSGDRGANRSAVLFEPSNSGTFAFYMNEPYPLQLLDSEGNSVPVRLQNDVPACPEHLGWFHVYEGLQAGQSYTLVLGPSAEVFVQIVVEVLAVFRGTLYRDADGDGFGSESESVQSWCGLAAGYSELSTDCAADDPDVFPGAEEACNGIDDDCDGELDETDCDEPAGGAGQGSDSRTDEDDRSGHTHTGGRPNEVGTAGSAGAWQAGAGGKDASHSMDPQGEEEPSISGRATEPGCSCQQAPSESSSGVGLGCVLVVLLGCRRRRAARTAPLR